MKYINEADKNIVTVKPLRFGISAFEVFHSIANYAILAPLIYKIFVNAQILKFMETACRNLSLK